MNAHNRFERRSLRDVLVDQGVLTEELADELITSARESSESFGSVLVDSGHITAWDLAKLVAMHFNMPCIPLAGFHYDADSCDDIPASTLYQYQVVPVGRFGQVRTFAMVEPPSRACIAALSDVCGNRLFFYVSEAHEIQRVLQENVKVVDTTADESWTNIFDTADQNVLEGNG